MFTVRAFLLGCLLTAFLGTGPLYVQFVHHTAPLNADSITAISLGWFSIMLGWLFKLFIVRYGGVRLYRTIRPFFIGLIAGQISCGASWMAIDYLTGMVGNWVSVGVP